MSIIKLADYLGLNLCLAHEYLTTYGRCLILEYLVPFEIVKVRGDNRAFRVVSQG